MRRPIIALASFVALAWLGFAACSSEDAAPGPADDERGEVCGDARLCTADDEGCAYFPYEQLPDRCWDICANHYCCASVDGRWSLIVYDCALPADAGVDAP